MKLSEWAKKQGVSYKTAWRWFKDGRLPVDAEQVPSGTIIIKESIMSKEKIFDTEWIRDKILKLYRSVGETDLECMVNICTIILRKKNEFSSMGEYTCSFIRGVDLPSDKEDYKTDNVLQVLKNELNIEYIHNSNSVKIFWGNKSVDDCESEKMTNQDNKLCTKVCVETEELKNNLVSLGATNVSHEFYGNLLFELDEEIQMFSDSLDSEMFSELIDVLETACLVMSSNAKCNQEELDLEKDFCDAFEAIICDEKIKKIGKDTKKTYRAYSDKQQSEFRAGLELFKKFDREMHGLLIKNEDVRNSKLSEPLTNGQIKAMKRALDAKVDMLNAEKTNVEKAFSLGLKRGDTKNGVVIHYGNIYERSGKTE
jgi:hypothetical protein